MQTETGPYLCVLDIETGGFSKQKNGIAEIAVMIITHAGTVVATRSWLIRPYPRPVELQETPGQLVSYKPDAMAVNGLTIERLEVEGEAAELVAQTIERILTDHGIDTLIGHNLKTFDKPWVEFFFERFGTGMKIPNVLDTMSIARENHKGLGAYDLQSLCKHFNIETTDQHRAGGDTEATRQLFLALHPKPATA